MPLKPLPYRQVRRKLEKAGFTIISQRGSHVKFVRYGDDGIRTVVVPHHREIPIGMLRTILRQAGLTPNEFERL
jgi:predicted RNA binding protein YcfA (HicA-like mRNA interferase family)